MNDDKDSVVSIALQLRQFELGGCLAKLLLVNESLVAENWGAYMLHKFNNRPGVVEDVLERLQHYDQIDYIRLARVMEKKSGTSDAVRFVKRCRDPLARLTFLFGKESSFDQMVVQDVVESLDGNAIIAFVLMKRGSISNPGDNFGPLLASHPVLADHYAAFKKFVDFKSLKQQELLPPLKMASLEILYGANRGLTFGTDADNIEKVKARLRPPGDKKKSDKDADVWVQMLANHCNIQERWARVRSTQPREQPPARVTKPPRLVMREAILQDDRETLKQVVSCTGVNNRMQCWVKYLAYLKDKSVVRLR
jgi:hypothetical protein